MTERRKRKGASRRHSDAQTQTQAGDDHHTVRESLRYVFAAARFGQIVEASTREEAAAAVRERHVDVVLLDLALGDGDGPVALCEIRAIDAAVPVLVHSYYKPRMLSQCFHAGAAGYVVKGRDKNALLQAVRQAVHTGSVWTAQQLEQIRTLDADRHPSRQQSTSWADHRGVATSATNE